MAGWFGVFGGSGDKASKPIYSIEHLQHLYSRLQHIKNDEDQNRDTMVEVIRQITEALIWGEQNGHDHNFFDFFCEKNILADFVCVLGVAKVPKTVKVQLLQTLSMLVQNIRRDTSLYYLFSRNYVNQLISTQFDWSDEEILGYYISFLKSLALRLNGETIKFFFNERSGSAQFPLYIEAVRFFGHHDQMVRTAVRTTTLQVYSVTDEAMQRFVLERSRRTYFVHLACHLRELWTKLDQAAIRATSSSSSEQASTALQEASEQQQDLLMYISDILGLESTALSEALVEKLHSYCLFPVLLGSLLPENLHGHTGDRGSTGDMASSSSCILSPATVLYVLHQVFETCKSSRILLEPLASALLGPRMAPGVLRRCLRGPPPPPATYRATNPDVSGPASQDGPPPEEEEADGAGEDGDDYEDGEVSVRSQLLGLLEGPTDACVLLAAGTLRACLACRKVLPDALLRAGGLLPAEEPQRPSYLLGLGTGGGSGEGVNMAGHPLELLLMVLRALERHTSLRVVVVQGLVQLTLDLAKEMASCRQEAWRSALLGAAKRVVQSAARHVRAFVQGESFLDIFAEDWDLHCRPQIALREACSSVRCLLPVGACSASSSLASAEWTLPTSHSERQHAAKAIRCLLTVRQLLQELPSCEQLALTLPAAATSSTYPLDVAEEAAEGYQEGRAFELGRQDRIVCGVVTPEGRQARYLVLNPFLLLLVQPDFENPGWALVKTLAPVRQVDSQVDRADPRTLRLYIRLLRGAACPSEASPCEAGGKLGAEESRQSSLFLLTLNFEDVKRCHCADNHLRRRRQEVRRLLQERAEAFIEGLCL